MLWQLQGSLSGPRLLLLLLPTCRRSLLCCSIHGQLGKVKTDLQLLANYSPLSTGQLGQRYVMQTGRVH